MNSRKLLTFGLVISGSFLIFELALIILVSGTNIFLWGKIIAFFYMVYMAFRLFKMALEIGKGNFLTNKQGFVGVSGFALIGLFSLLVGQGAWQNNISGVLFRLGVGLFAVAISFLVVSFFVWVTDHRQPISK